MANFPMPFNFSQRLRDLEDNIAQDEQLLKDFEDALRYEDDPRRKRRYQQEVRQIKQSVEGYRREYEAMQQQGAGESPELQQVAAKIEQMDAKLNLMLSGQVDIYQMQRSLLERYEAGEQRLVETLTQELSQSQLTLTQALLDALEAGCLSEGEMQQMVAAVEQRLPRVAPGGGSRGGVGEGSGVGGAASVEGVRADYSVHPGL
ncbi:hypothetical protein HC928_23125 [bacterium]|nr:hypothetical protein [bacterium]